MKKLSLLFLAFILTSLASAQSEKGRVYLKNGSVLKGKYSYSEDLSQIKINSDGNLWIFDYAEIDSVVSKRSSKENVYSTNAEAKFFFHSEIGFLLGNDDNNQTAPLSFTTSLNYLVKQQFAAGVGLGVELLDETYMPVYANFNYKLRNGNSTPFLFLRAGYQVPLEDTRKVYDNYYYRPHYSHLSSYMPYYPSETLENKGGYLINTGVGYQRLYSPNFGITVTFGYQHHRLHYEGEGEGEYALDIDYNRLTIKLGILFN